MSDSKADVKDDEHLDAIKPEELDFSVSSISVDKVKELDVTATTKLPTDLLSDVPIPDPVNVVSTPGPAASPVGSSPSAVAAFRRQLTQQVLGRQPPIIVSSEVDRSFLLRLSQLPWSEQRKLKAAFDQALNSKRPKKAAVTVVVEPTGGRPPVDCLRQGPLPTKLELRQVGRSVKYMKAHERNAAASLQAAAGISSAASSDPQGLALGSLSGEWEAEHSFVCSVCCVEYDDVLEIMHHKWEAHPHCLVEHVSLREKLLRPPALLYPQVRFSSPGGSKLLEAVDFYESRIVNRHIAAVAFGISETNLLKAFFRYFLPFLPNFSF